MIQDYEGDEQPVLINTKVEPKGNPDSKEIRKGWLRTLGEFIGLVRRYTADDLTRIKNAGVNQIESKAKLIEAEATLRLAEAEERFAEAEVKRKKAEAEILLSKAEALERVINAISKIKQEGGTVGFDLEQLTQLLGVSDNDELRDLLKRET